MSLTRTCCCTNTCVNPTGTHTIVSTFRAVASKTDSTIGTDTRVQTFDYLQELEFDCNNDDVLNTSTARFAYTFDLDWTNPDPDTGETVTLCDSTRALDITMNVDGQFRCNSGSSHTCGDCGIGENFGAIYTFGPRLRVPYILGSGTQILTAPTVNSYTNTQTGIFCTSTPLAAGIVIRNSSERPVTYPARGGYLYNGTNLSQWSSSTSVPSWWQPLRVYRNSKTSGNPNAVCNPEWAILTTSTTNAPFSGIGWASEPLCPADKTALESDGWTFTTYTRTASIT